MQFTACDNHQIESPPRAIYRILSDVASYSNWWPRVVDIRVLVPSATLVGTRFRVRPLGASSFDCRVERVIENELIEVSYCGGAYRGTGIWQLRPTSVGTAVSYSVDLQPTSSLGRFLAWLFNAPRLHSLLMGMLFKRLQERTTRSPKATVTHDDARESAIRSIRSLNDSAIIAG